MFLADPHWQSQLWIKYFCSVVLTFSLRHILMKLEIQKIFLIEYRDKTARREADFVRKLVQTELKRKRE